MLSKKRKREYVKDPSVCPFCCTEGSIEKDELIIEGDMELEISRTCTCSNCEEVWTEFYKLSDVM